MQYTAFCLHIAIRIVSDGPSGYLKQSFQKTIFTRQAHPRRLQQNQKQRSCSIAVQVTQNTSFLSFTTVFVIAIIMTLIQRSSPLRNLSTFETIALSPDCDAVSIEAQRPDR